MIAVTGATGLTGSFLISAFRELGYQGKLRCLVRQTSDTQGLKADPGIELMIGDCRNVESLVRLAEGADALVHVAGIQTAENVIAACNQVKLKRVVFVNTTGMFSRYRKYAADYQRIEKEILGSGLDYTIIRPTMIYGNARDHNIHKLVGIINRFPIVPVIDGGRALIQPVYAKDLAAVIARATLNPGNVKREYIVAGKEPITYLQLLKYIAAALRKKRWFISVPYAAALVVGYLGEVIPNSLINVERVQRLREDKAFDYSLAREELGFSPCGFEEGIKLEVTSMRENGDI